MDCVSAATLPDVGRWLDPSGVDVTNSNTDPFDVVVGDVNDPSHLRITSSSSITVASQGVYTCILPDRDGADTYRHVGIYPNGFNSKPIVSDTLHRSILILHCILFPFQPLSPSLLLGEVLP